MATKSVIGAPIFNRIEHVCARLGVSRSYFYRQWITSGRVAVIKIGTRTLIEELELQRVAAEIVREAADPAKIERTKSALVAAGKNGAKGLADRRKKDVEELSDAISALNERKAKLRK